MKNFIIAALISFTCVMSVPVAEAGFLFPFFFGQRQRAVQERVIVREVVVPQRQRQRQVVERQVNCYVKVNQNNQLCCARTGNLVTDQYGRVVEAREVQRLRTTRVRTSRGFQNVRTARLNVGGAVRDIFLDVATINALNRGNIGQAFFIDRVLR